MNEVEQLPLFSQVPTPVPSDRVVFKETHSDCVVYVDESGDHSLSSVDKNYPIFVLGMVFKTPVKPEWRERCAAGTMAS